MPAVNKEYRWRRFFISCSDKSDKLSHKRGVWCDVYIHFHVVGLLATTLVMHL